VKKLLKKMFRSFTNEQAAEHLLRNKKVSTYYKKKKVPANYKVKKTKQRLVRTIKQSNKKLRGLKRRRVITARQKRYKKVKGDRLFFYGPRIYAMGLAPNRAGLS
jgi:hypothetical protein